MQNKYWGGKSKQLNSVTIVLYHCTLSYSTIILNLITGSSMPVLLPGKSHGRRSLVHCSPWGHEESDTTEPLHFHFSLSCIGEGNGNTLQCSCLENPWDGSLVGCCLWGRRVGHDWSDLAAAASAVVCQVLKKLKVPLPQINKKISTRENEEELSWHKECLRDFSESYKFLKKVRHVSVPYV